MIRCEPRKLCRSRTSSSLRPVCMCTRAVPFPKPETSAHAQRYHLHTQLLWQSHPLSQAGRHPPANAYVHPNLPNGTQPHPPPPPPQGRPRSPKTVQSAEGGEGKDKRERIIVVVRSPCQENYPADAHPSAHKSVLESANPAWTRNVHLDAPGQQHGQQPVSGTADPGVVKHDKSSGGSVDTTKTRSDPQRVRMSSGERPIGTAKGKQSDTKALCQTLPSTPASPPPLHSPVRGGGVTCP